MADRTSAVLCRARTAPVPCPCRASADLLVPPRRAAAEVQLRELDLRRDLPKVPKRFRLQEGTRGTATRRIVQLRFAALPRARTDSSATERKPARAKTRVGRV